MINIIGKNIIKYSKYSNIYSLYYIKKINYELFGHTTLNYINI